MIKEVITDQNKYGRFFLSLEAPEDEEVINDETSTEDNPIKYNTKIITVKPRLPRTKIFKAGDDEVAQDDDVLDDNYHGDEPTETDNGDNPEVVNDVENQETPGDVETPAPEVTVDGEPVENEQPVDGQQDDSPMTDDADFSEVDPLVQQVNDTNAEIDNTDVNAPATDDSTDTNAEINTDEPMTDDADFSGTDDPMDGEQPTDGSVPPPPPEGEQKKGPGIEYDSTRKYSLFKKYVDLCSSIEDYVDKLSELTNDDANTNQIYKVAIAKLQDVYNVTYDYMVMRFELSTYVQSLLFYQERIATVYKIFNLISSSLNTLSKKQK